MENQSYPTIKDFVLQQAQERAFETLVLGLKDYQKEKQKLVQEKKELIHTEYDKKVKDNNATKRIQRSLLINGSRMKKMQQRHIFLNHIIKLTQQRLVSKIIGNQTSYKSLLKNLILQGLIRMLEPKVYVRCLKRDKKLIESIISDCKKEFKKLIEKDGIDSQLGQVDLQVDNRYSLQEKSIHSDAEKQESKMKNQIDVLEEQF